MELDDQGYPGAYGHTDLRKGWASSIERDSAAMFGSAVSVPDLLSDGSPVMNADLLKTETYKCAAYNRYYTGPDFSSGFGLVNAKNAVAHVDTNLFKQDSIDNGELQIYTITVPSGTHSVRVTLAWDDYPGNPSAPGLVNSLTLSIVSPSGAVYNSWGIPPLPRGRNSLSTGRDPIYAATLLFDTAALLGDNKNNLLVLDVPTDVVVAGTWRIHIRGTSVPMGPQSYSLVSDFQLRRFHHAIGWLANGGSCPG